MSTAPEWVIVGDAQICYTVVRSQQRKKTLTITVAADGVQVAAPLRATRDELRAAVTLRAPWILKHLALLAERPPPRTWNEGELVPFLGRPLALRLQANRRRFVCAEDDQLVVSGPDLEDERARVGTVELAVSRWLRTQAASYFPQRARDWSAVVGAEPSAVLVRDQKRRWGSCSSDRTLRFNWRLIMAPPEIGDYVVVHELAHLRVPNHSPAFWAEVERVLPDYRDRRQELKRLSPTLAR
jgi:predicted metal-dependent hydrolase